MDREQQIATQIFSGSLAILAIFIAVVGFLLGQHDQYSAVSYLGPKIRNMIAETAILAAVAAAAGCMSLARMQGYNIPMPLVLSLAYGLIILTAGLTISMAFL